MSGIDRHRAWNPLNRFDARSVELDLPPPPPGLRVQVDQARSAIRHNQSPDLGHSHTLNPYRGCTHACAYCYARETHEALGLGAGSDFERVILVKRGLPALLEAELSRPGWGGHPVMMSGVTDPYQRIERDEQITRACLELFVRFRNPVAIITRSPLILRDLDLLVQLAAHDAVRVSFSVPLFDPALARALEPGAPAPAARLRAMAALAEAGVPVGLSLAPVVPGLGDRLVPQVIAAAAEAGAQWAWGGLVRLPGSVAEVFSRALALSLPARAADVLSRLRRARGGALDDPRFGHRFTSPDPAYQATERLIEVCRARHGLRDDPPPWPSPSPFRVPGGGVQQGLFGPAPGASAAPIRRPPPKLRR